MIRFECAEVSDLLPELAAERLDEHARTRIDAHLDVCAECRAELALVRALEAGRMQPPPGLEARIRRELASPRTPARRWAAGQLAVAASLVLALVTAGLLVGPKGLLQRDAAPEAGGAESSQTLRAVVEDPLLHGGPGLGALSVDELEVLLAELES